MDQHRACPGLGGLRASDRGRRAPHRNREALRDAVEAKLAARTVSEWVEIVNAAGIPCGPVLALDQVFADPQVRHLGVAQTLTHASDGPVTLLRLPLNFSSTPASIRSAAPIPGADTREILAECGYGEAEIEGLVRCGAAADSSEAPGWPGR
jgi:formyl-CoA transferase